MTKWLVVAVALVLIGGRFPEDAGVVDVTDYGAVPNDGLDDWAAFEAAKLESFGRVMYVPDGVWDLSAPLTAKNTAGKWVANWVVHCESRGAVIRLQPNSPAFAVPQGVLVFGSTDGNAPSSVPSGGGDEGFRNSVYNCSVDRGTGNPGAVGVDWVCNNRGVLRGVHIFGGGRETVSMARAYPGPCLIVDSDLEGGTRGLYLTQVQYGVTLRNVRMSGQSVAGVETSANLIHAEDLEVTTTGNVPAVKMTGPGAQLVCVHCRFRGATTSKSAVELGVDTKAFIRDSVATGFASLVRQGTVTVPGLEVEEWVSHATVPPGAESLRLRELYPPRVPEGEVWAAPVGCSPGDTGDDLACAQSAADSGADVLYFPSVALPLIPRWRFSGVLNVPCSVRRVVGLETIWVNHGTRPVGLPLLRFDGGCSPDDVTVVEGLWGQAALNGGAWVEHLDRRTLYLRDLQMAAGNRGVVQGPGAGRLFLENVALRSVELNGNVWAWQLDLEGLGVGPTSHVAGRLRAVGVKTEGLAANGSPTLHVRPGGSAELLGGLYMPCVGEGGAPPALGFLAEGSFTYVGTNWCSAPLTAAAWAVQVRTPTADYTPGDLLTTPHPPGWKVMAPLFSTRPGTCVP